jgi:hypothetical protein
MYVGHILENKPMDMKHFDTTRIVKAAERHLETIKEPRRRQILQNFIEHARTEGSGDYEGLMASCSRKQQHYASYGSRFGAPQTYAELETHYRGLIEANIYLIDFEPEKLIVGDDALVLEGLVHQLYPGNLIEPMYGFEVDDPEAVYQATKRTCVFFVFDDDGMGAGEHSYSDGPLTADDLVKLSPDEVPEAFHHNPLSG